MAHNHNVWNKPTHAHAHKNATTKRQTHTHTNSRNLKLTLQSSSGRIGVGRGGKSFFQKAKRFISSVGFNRNNVPQTELQPPKRSCTYSTPISFQPRKSPGAMTKWMFIRKEAFFWSQVIKGFRGRYTGLNWVWYILSASVALSVLV